MWWLYLDESGDLGFDFVNKKPSRYFTITILATSHLETNNAMKRAVKRTLKNKLNHNSQRNEIELKGSSTTFEIKEYALRQLKNPTFGIYALTLNKKRLYTQLMENKNHVYNYIARLVTDRIPFEQADGQVQLVIDKSKGKKQCWEFNEYIRSQLEGRLALDVKVDFLHDSSEKWPGLQWADLFAWGIFQKHERKNCQWYDLFKDYIRFEEIYLK
jgi:hypothetical protein